MILDQGSTTGWKKLYVFVYVTSFYQTVLIMDCIVFNICYHLNYYKPIILNLHLYLYIGVLNQKMNFSKQPKKYFLEELKGNITNNFNFSIKSLHQNLTQLEKRPQMCAECKLPLTASICGVCKVDNKFPEETQFSQKFVYKESVSEDQNMEDSMILCIDLSGSMSCTYRSKYKKVNEDFVCRILGQKNFQFMKRKIGLEKLMNNYSVYQMLLSEGQSARNIVQMVKMEENNKYGSSAQRNKQAEKQKPKQEVQQYISRKQIIEVTVARCLQIIKSRSPNTHITAVYFNDTIEIPTNNFNDKLVIHDIETKTVDEMVNLGTEYASHISKQKASALGQNLSRFLTKAVQNGQTALGPALAFSLGLAKAFHHNLTQIVVITDGMSNIGFGQTQNELEDETKKFYAELAIKYAKPMNCVVDVLTFEDCCIGYEQLDQLVQFTGGIPCQIQFIQEGGQKTVNEETFSNISFRMTVAFCEYINQLCFQTKTTIFCNNNKVQLNIPNQLKPFVEVHKGNFVVLKTGIRSNSSLFQINFTIPDDLEQLESTVKFTIINEYKKNNKKTITMATQKIKVIKGTKAQAEKEEANILQKQIKQKLKPRQIFEEDLNSYSNISLKIEENESIVESLDKQLLQKFKAKKQVIEAEYKNVDKMARQKMSMRSRAQKTFKQDDFDDGFM